jgi:hypothetical protein
MRSAPQQPKRTTAAAIPNMAADIAALREQLGDISTKLDALAKAVGEADRGSFTIKEFLRRNHLSETAYHTLRREGRGPRTMATGNVGVRISRQAELDWIKEREDEAAARKVDAA